MIKVTAVLLGHVAYWLLLFLVVLLMLFKLLLYLLANPVSELADRMIVRSSQNLGEALGQEVEISYASMNLDISLEGMHLVVAEPSISIGENALHAPKAQLVMGIMGFEGGVTLHIDSADLQFVAQDDGSFTLAGATLPLGLASDKTPESLRENIPASIIATNTNISFVTAKGDRYALTDVNLGGSYDAQNEQMQISFYTDYGADIGARGRVNISAQTNNVEGYFRLRDAEQYLERLNLPVKAANSFVDVWATYDGNAVDAILHAQAKDIVVPLAFAAETDEPDASLRVPYQMTATTVALHSKLARPLSLEGETEIQLDWTMETSDLNVNLREPFLGIPLILEKIDAQGVARHDEQGWGVIAPKIYAKGPLGTGQFSLTVSQTGSELPFVDASGFAPIIDFATLANLLPLGLGEPGVRFLRDNLQATRMQASTLVVQGSDWEKFPWPGDDGGKFRMQADFFGATLNYDDDYPKLTDGTGAMGLEGTALAVTVASGNSGPAKIAIARAGIDDMDAVESTLFVAADLQLADGSLFELLNLLPDTKDVAAKVIGDMRLSGAQGLDIDVVVPLDTDDPVSIGGAVRPGDGNVLTYVPLELTLSELTGDFNFDKNGVQGIGFASMLDTGVRLSLAVKGGTPQVQIDGTFDLAAAMAKLGIGDSFPFSGSSQVIAKANDEQISLSSSLEGTTIDLPTPFGKSGSQPMPLQVEIDAQGTKLDYGDGLIKAALSADGKAAVALNAEQMPDPRKIAGTSVSGILPNLDLDDMTQGDGGFDLPLAQPIEIDLDMPGALLLGIEHPLLDLQATLASTLTVAMFDSQALSGSLRQDASSTLVISLSHLHFPESEDASDIDSDATIYVEPGTLSPALPALDLTIDELRQGEQVYLDVNAQGEPQEDTWQLSLLQAKLPGEGNKITASGTTNTAGTPYTSIDINIASSNLGAFVGNFSEGESIKEGTGSLAGTLNWEGSLTSPHFLSMAGTLDLQANDFVLNRDSQGVKLLNLLSPFTLLSSLDGINEEGFQFDEAKGKLAFGDGLLNFEQLEMKGKDIDIGVTGNTNLVTERNDMTSHVKIKKSDNVATTAVAVAAPLAGAFLLFADKILGVKFLDDLEVEYSIKGTWNEPETQAVVGDNEQADQSDNQ